MRGARLLLVLASVLSASSADAERLPVRTYSTADGLPTPMVLRISRDSRGFLWFATRDGFSRFDGVRFVNYTTRDGLPLPTVNHVLETRRGEYLVATNGAGVLRFNVNPLVGQPRFETLAVGDSVAANRVNVLLDDRDGRLWAATDGGLLVRAAGAGTFVAQRPANRPEWRPNASSLAEDAQGTIWVTTPDGLLRTSAAGLQHLRVSAATPDIVNALKVEEGGALWIGLETDGLLYVPASAREAVLQQAAAGMPLAASPLVRRYSEANGLADNRVTALHQMSDGTMWVGTGGGISLIRPDGASRPGAPRGLPADRISWFCEDSVGDLWMASSTGAHKLTANGLTTFDRTSGLPEDAVHALYADGEGGVHVVSGHYALTRFDGEQFVVSHTPLPGLPRFSWQNQVAYLARDGSWWLLTSRGVWRIPPSAAGRSAMAQATLFTAKEGLVSDSAFRIYETGDGSIWIAGQAGGLARWNPSADRFHVVPDVVESAGPITALGGDARGNVWVGFMSGTLARVSPVGMTWFDAGQAAAPVSAFHRDARGRLWIATSGGGVLRVDDPAGARLNATRYTTDTGLASDNVRCIVDDEEGRLYFGTVRGVDRLDVQSGRVRHFTTGDGLAHEFVTAAARDGSGALWFGTTFGVSRLNPSRDVRRPAPPVWIASLRIDGTPYPVPELGAANIDGVVLAPGQDSVEMEVLTIAAGMGETVRMQYRLADSAGVWSPPTLDRRFMFARLAPGDYRFEVRAVAADGAVSETPAVLAFQILPPFWMRPWFMAAAAALLVLASYQAHRVRVRRAVELERVRMRIAADLHDDIGSNLSKITLLSEILKREVPAAEVAARARVGSIARVANDSIDAMADIVWAIDPARDTAGDLVQRMRRHAGDTFAAAGIALDFAGDGAEQAISLDSHVRREVLLIFKEALHNIVRHAACDHVRIRVSAERRLFSFEIVDNGRGFAPGAAVDGRGLANMRARAIRLGGVYELTSAPGAGTTIRLTVAVTAAGRPAHASNSTNLRSRRRRERR